MALAQLNNTQNGHSKAITDISQVTKSSKVNVPEPIDTIEFLLKTRTGNYIADWNNILQACQLIFDKYQCNYLPVVNKKYFETELECCYCGHKIKAKYYMSQCKYYMSQYNRQTSLPQLFRSLCLRSSCPGNLASNKQTNNHQSTWRPTDGTWRTRPHRYTYTTKSKKKSTIPVKNAAFLSKIIQPTDNSLNHTLIELHHRVSSEKILNAIQTKQYSAVLQELTNQIEVYTKLLELL